MPRVGKPMIDESRKPEEITDERGYPLPLICFLPIILLDPLGI